MDKMRVSIKIIGANNIFGEYLDQEYVNVLMEAAAGAFIFKIKENEEIFMNMNPKVKCTEKGILLEGYCIIGNSLGNLSILITKLS
jgi:hypothetical protein